MFIVQKFVASFMTFKTFLRLHTCFCFFQPSSSALQVVSLGVSCLSCRLARTFCPNNLPMLAAVKLVLFPFHVDILLRVVYLHSFVVSSFMTLHSCHRFHLSLPSHHICYAFHLHHSLQRRHDPLIPLC